MKGPINLASLPSGCITRSPPTNNAIFLLGKAANTELLTVQMEEVHPGLAVGTPGSSEKKEEFFLIISGKASVMMGKHEPFDVSEGDFFAKAEGESGLPYLMNTGSCTLRFLRVGLKTAAKSNLGGGISANNPIAFIPRPMPPQPQSEVADSFAPESIAPESAFAENDPLPPRTTIAQRAARSMKRPWVQSLVVAIGAALTGIVIIYLASLLARHEGKNYTESFKELYRQHGK